MKNILPRKLEPKYKDEFRQWIVSQYGPLVEHRSCYKMYAAFRVKGRLVKIYHDRPTGKYIDLFWDFKIASGFRGKIPRYRGDLPLQVKNGKVEYRQYIKSLRWFDKRKQCIKSANNECEACGSKDNLNAHHYNYKRLGSELPSDLFCLCKSCHDFYHTAYQSNQLPKDTSATRIKRLIHVLSGIRKGKQILKEK